MFFPDAVCLSCSTDPTQSAKQIIHYLSILLISLLTVALHLRKLEYVSLYEQSVGRLLRTIVLLPLEEGQTELV